MASNQIAGLLQHIAPWALFLKLEDHNKQQLGTSRTKSSSSQVDIDRQGTHAQLDGHVMSAKRSDSLFFSEKWIKRCSDPDNCFTVTKDELLLSRVGLKLKIKMH
jgi:hypothetical protein